MHDINEIDSVTVLSCAMFPKTSGADTTSIKTGTKYFFDDKTKKRRLFYHSSIIRKVLKNT